VSSPASPSDVARRLFAAVEARDLEAVLASYDPDVEIHEAGSLPYGGTYAGLDGATRHAVAYAGTWDPLQTDAERTLDWTVVASGDEEVVVRWHQRGLDPDTGAAFDGEVVSVYRVRDGRVREARMFHADTDAVVRFLGAAGTRVAWQVTEVTVHDADAFAEYGRGVFPMMKHYGGQMLGISLGTREVVEGDWRPPLLIVSRWASRGAFHAMYDDPAYQPLKQLRHKATDCNLVLFD
jgi:uncharacterized protein (DUF1330 family)/ketosteroid isomerase-like protein